MKYYTSFFHIVKVDVYKAVKFYALGLGGFYFLYNIVHFHLTAVLRRFYGKAVRIN